MNNDDSSYERARAYFERAIKAAEKGDMNMAKGLLLEANTFTPNRQSILRNLAVVSLNLKEYDEARNYAFQCCRLPDHSEADVAILLEATKFKPLTTVLLDFIRKSPAAQRALEKRSEDAADDNADGQFTKNLIGALGGAGHKFPVGAAAVTWLSLLVKAGKTLEAEKFLYLFASAHDLSLQTLLRASSVAADIGLPKLALEILSNAQASHEKAPEVRVNKAAIYMRVGDAARALEEAQVAISLNPRFGYAWLNKAEALAMARRSSDAVVAYAQAFSLGAAGGESIGNFLAAKLRIHDWDGVDGLVDEILAGVANGQKLCSPFLLLALVDNPEVHRAAASLESDSIKPPSHFISEVSAKIAAVSRLRKLRVAYISSDFKNHATTQLITAMIEGHSRERFEWVGVSIGAGDDSLLGHRIRRAFDEYYDLASLTSSEIVKFCRNLNLNVAVDLKGYTFGSRPEIFRYRVAPVQVNYLGYPGTCAIPEIDYIITDDVIAPSQFWADYSEAVISLSCCYQPNDPSRFRPAPISRGHLGLSERSFVFACFNNSYKILPSVFEDWMAILRACNDAVLWLMTESDEAEENLRSRAAFFGVEKSRLIFCRRSNYEVHLTRMSVADLFLDTFPYAAHTTASEALWVGLPVLTRRGRSFASRVASSLLRRFALDGDLSVDSRDSYRKRAIDLYHRRDELTKIKLRLLEMRGRSELFLPKTLSSKLEAAYLAISDNYSGGRAPAHFRI